MTTYQGFDVNFEPNLSESFRKVPHDLLNINEIKYNDEWAKQTFKYFHLFRPFIIIFDFINIQQIMRDFSK